MKTQAQVFLCKGCGQLRPANPCLAPGVQEFCSRRACQLKRGARWRRRRVATDSKYASDQREADDCWHKKVPDYHKTYDADRKKPPDQRQKRRKVRGSRRRRQRVVTLRLGTHALRVSIARAPGSGQGESVGGNVELVVVRVQPAPDQARSRESVAKDRRAPTPEIASQSGS